MAELNFPWERAAMGNDPMPDGLPLEEQMAYQTMAALYGRHRLKLITREQGHLEKGRIIYAYNRRHRQEELSRELAEQTAKMYRAIEGVANAYAKCRTLENADRLYQAIYGMMPEMQHLAGM